MYIYSDIFIKILHHIIGYFVQMKGAFTVANFAIFKINRDILILPFTLVRKILVKFQSSQNFAIFWLVVRICAITGYSACIHKHESASICSMNIRAEDIDTRFKERT